MTAVQLLQEMFELLSPTELRQTADTIIHHASDGELQAEYDRRRQTNQQLADQERSLMGGW